MKSKFLCFFACLLGSISIAVAQTSQTTGVVTSSDDGQPIIGASVLVMGTTTGTITDFDGKFSIKNIPASAKKIRISYVGMKTMELTIKPFMKVVMESDSEVLDEVVITGMQKVDKRLFTGSSTKLNAADTKLDGIADVSRALEGRAAGVSVQNVSGAFGAAPKIRVRGATSIYGSSKPLWVVDGVIMEDVTEVSADDLASGDPSTLISSVIAGLNADDIESFDVLKDGSATSIYGARAMAGVIVITTKKGKVGMNQISYTGEYTYRLTPDYDEFNIMNSQEQMGVYKEMESAGYLNLASTYRKSNSGVYGRMYHLINTYNPETGYGLPNTDAAKNAYLRKAEYRNTDWFSQLFNKNISKNHSISMTTGTEKASYYISMSMMDDPGWTVQSQVKRYTANLNANFKLHKSLSLNLISNTSYRKQRAPGSLNQDTDVVSGQVKRDFDINPYSYALNTSRVLDPDVYYARNYAPFNVKHELQNNYIDINMVDLRFQAELKYKPISKVELSLLGAYKYSVANRTHRITEKSNQALAYNMQDDSVMRDGNPFLYSDPDKPNTIPVSVLPYGGFYNTNKNEMRSYDMRATASYNDVFSEDYIFNAFGGMEINAVDRLADSFDGVGLQYENGLLPAYDHNYFKKLSETNGDYFTVKETRGRQASFFATTTLSYKGTYTLNLTGRYEGSNKMGKSRASRWLPTWNVSGAWNISNEKFFAPALDAVSHLTLKGSYSLTATSGPSWVSNSRVVIQAFNPFRPFANDKESGLEIKDLENSELTYEKKHELNIGLDAGFLNDRISLTADWYQRRNYDLIGLAENMGIGGQLYKYANVADMKSSGLELSLSTVNIKTKDFRWNTSFIFTKTHNEISKLNSSLTRAYSLVMGNGYALEGYPVRSLFSYDFRGLDSDGLPTFINRNGEVTTTDINFQNRDNLKDYLVYEGASDPDKLGSLGNTFTYKDFSLNVFMTYAFGNVVRLDPAFHSTYSDLDAMPKEFVNRWTLPGDEKYTDVPAIATLRQSDNISNLNYGYNAYNYSSARIAKGDFIRMKEISLAYKLPKSWLKDLWIKRMSLKLQATNLFLIYSDSKLNGQDPEFMNSGGVATPVPKQYTLTLRVGL